MLTIKITIEDKTYALRTMDDAQSCQALERFIIYPLSGLYPSTQIEIFDSHNQKIYDSAEAGEDTVWRNYCQADPQTEW